MSTDLQLGLCLATEIGPDRVTLQARLCGDWTGGGYGREGTPDGDLPARKGFMRIELSGDDFATVSADSGTLAVTEPDDGIARWTPTGLAPDTAYAWRAVWGPTSPIIAGPVCTLRTLPAASSIGTPGEEYSVAITSCQMHEAYLAGRGTYESGSSWVRTQPSAEGVAGQPGWEAMLWGDDPPDYPPRLALLIGDNVYPDGPGHPVDETEAALRMRYHRMASEERFRRFARGVPIAAQYDDHDCAAEDDGDGNSPLFPLCSGVAREQLGIPTPGYRVIQLGRLAHLFVLDVRTHRDSNGPSLLGATQLAWLQAEMAASDAAWLILVSPTPAVGPDRSSKNDGWCGSGFAAERAAFGSWLAGEGLTSRTLVVCGDRHWQYHSEAADGLEEVSTGPLCAENVVASSTVDLTAPGEPTSSDPSGTVTRHYAAPVAGFVRLTFRRADTGSGVQRVKMLVEQLSEGGDVLHVVAPTRVRAFP